MKSFALIPVAIVSCPQSPPTRPTQHDIMHEIPGWINASYISHDFYISTSVSIVETHVVMDMFLIPFEMSLRELMDSLS